VIDCITIDAAQEVDEQTKKDIAEIASKLREANQSDVDFRDLNKRRVSVTKIADLATSEPAAVIPYIPLLVQTLDDELTRNEFKDSAANIVYPSVSRDIRHRVTEVVETLSMGAVVTQYQESDESLSSLFGVLARAIIEDDDTVTILNSLRALCGFSQYCPKKVAEAIANKGDSAAVLNLYTQVLVSLLNHDSSPSSTAVTSRGSVGWWTRFAAVIIFQNQHPDYLPSTHAFRRIPNNLQDADDNGVVVFGELLKRIMPSKRELDTVQESGWASVPVYAPLSDSVETVSVELGFEGLNAPDKDNNTDLSPIERIEQKGPDTDDSEAFGEIIVACPHVVPNPPWDLIDHLRGLDHRQYAARALGGVAAAGATNPTEQIQLATRWIDANKIYGWQNGREMLGEIAAAHSNLIDIPDPIRPVVRKVRTGEGQSRINAAIALGEAVYQSRDHSTAVDPTPALRQHLREEQPSADAAARGLGEAIITMGPQDCSVSVPSVEIDHVRGDRGQSRRYSTEALGWATVTDSLDDLPTTLVSEAHTKKGQTRWEAGRTLGELVGILDASNDSTPWPESLLEQLRGTDGQLRFESAELVGVAISALEADAHGIDDSTKLGRVGLSGPDRLLLYVLTRRGMARNDMQKVVGELVVSDALPEHTPEIFHPLVRQTANANDFERSSLTGTLGEAVAVAAGTDSGFGTIYALRRQVQTETGEIRSQAAQALGEAIAVFDGSSQTTDLEGELANAVRGACGEGRWHLARSLGELHAAVDEPISGCEPIEILMNKARSGDEVDWPATAAIGAITILDPDGIDLASAVPNNLLAEVDSKESTDYRTALEAVGSAVLGIVDTFVRTAVNDAIESPGRKNRAELLPVIAATEFFSLEEFLYILITANPNDDERGLKTCLESDSRVVVISALRELLSGGATGFEDNLRRFLESHLSSEETPTLDSETRLALIDCLVNCPPSKQYHE